MPEAFARALCAIALFASFCPISPLLAEQDIDDAIKMPTAPMREQVLQLHGDPTRPVALEATLFEPPGNGPFPLAVMNHGAGGDPRTVKRYRTSFSIDYLLSRGYAVLAPMMRGFSASGGNATIAGCDVALIGRQNARDILAAIGEMRGRAEIDTSRVLAFGQSYGGWNSLALATMAPPELKGVVNFVGGVRTSDCGYQEAAMLDGMAQFGRDSLVPSLWFYGRRDDIFPEQVWRANYRNFSSAGGRARLVELGNIPDAHNVLGQAEYLELWIPEVDAYLAERGLPNRELYPEFLPTRRPPKTNYASIADTALVPFIGRTHAEFYQKKFLESEERPRAIAVSAKTASVQRGGFDPIARAMAECARQESPCVLYAFDDDVVWTGPAPGQTARIDGVPIIGKVAASGTIKEVQRFAALTETCEPRPLPQFAVAAKPAHGSVEFVSSEDSPQIPAQNALSACNSHKLPIVSLTYRSEMDFRGVDFFAITIAERDGSSRTIKYAVHVGQAGN